MTIEQTSQRAAISWQSFNIGKDASVNVVQPTASSVLLNRIGGDSPSQILGRLSANGQIVLINPNGMLFGKDGSVSAAALTASSLGISDADFMAGNMKLSRNGATGTVVNQGRLETNGGVIALLGAQVSNEGRIYSNAGHVYMGAAETVQLPISGSGRIKLELSPSAINAVVRNTGDIVTIGGQVFMQAAAASAAVANVIQSGSVDTSAAQAGSVHLWADGGQIRVDGRITANSSDEQNKGGDIVIGRDVETGMLARDVDVSRAHLESRRGFVETSGEQMNVSGIDILTGKWLIDPIDVEINNGGTITQAGYTQISNATINAALNSGADVVISTVGAGSAAGITSPTFTGAGGNIVISGDVIKSSSGADANASLTLQVAKNITLNKSIKSISGKLGITLEAGLTDNAGYIALPSGLMLEVRSNGGDILFKTQNGNITVGSSFPVSSNGGNITFQSTGSSTIEAYSNVDAGSGNVVFQNQGGLIRPRGLATIGGTNISFDNTGGTIDPATGFISRNVNQLAGRGIEIFNANLLAIGNVSVVGISDIGAPGVKIQQSSLQAPNYGKISAGADITIYGKSTGERGILAYLGALIQSTGGRVSLTGNGQSTANLTDIDIQDYSVVKAAGHVELVGENRGVSLGNNRSSASGVGSSSLGGNLSISTDALTLNAPISAANGTVSLSNYSAGLPIQVAGASDVVNSLNINATEISNITASRLVVGSSNAGDIVLAGALTTSSDLELVSGGNLAINATLQTGLKNLTINLTGNGTATESAAASLQTSGLELLGRNASFMLNNTTNDADTLAVTAKTVSYTDANAVTIGRVRSTRGITTSGIVSVATQGGNLSVTEAVSTTDTSAVAIVLNAGLTSGAGTAGGGDIELRDGFNFSTGTGGRTTLYTGHTSNTNLSSFVGYGSGRFRYSSDESASNFSAVLGSGLYAIYRETPIYTVTFYDLTKTYDGHGYNGGNGYAIGGSLNGDANAGATGEMRYAGSSQGALNAGTYTISGGGLSSSLGYVRGGINSGVLTIGKADLSLTGTRTYDGGTSFAGQYLIATGVNGETFSVTGTGHASNLASKHVADNQGGTLNSVTGLALGTSNNGGLGDNYNALSPTGSSVTLTQANLTLNAVSDSKTYDASTSSRKSVVVSGLQIGDTVTGLSQSFDSKNAGSHTLAVDSGYTVNDGNSGGNYTISTQAVSGSITRKDVTLSAMIADNKTYDGNDRAAVTSANVQGTVAGETLSVSGSGTFDTKNAGNGKTVTVADVALLNKDNGSGDWANYNLSTMGALTATATITPKAITVSGIAVNDKVYDGTLSASVSTTAANFNGMINGDDLSVLATGSFADKNAGSGKRVLLSSVYGGNDLNNYTITDQTHTSATISKAELTLQAVSDTKTYDASTHSSQSVQVSGLLSGDTVTGLSQSFNTKNAGRRTLAIDNGYTVNDGNGGGNYTIHTPTANGAISPKAIEVTATPTTVMFNGKPQTQSLPQVKGLLDGANLSIVGLASGTVPGTYMSSLSLAGADSGNYAATFSNALLVIESEGGTAFQRPVEPQILATNTLIRLAGFGMGSGVGAALAGQREIKKDPVDICTPESSQACDCDELSGLGVDVCHKPR